jgi:hypothetical protein
LLLFCDWTAPKPDAAIVSGSRHTAAAAVAATMKSRLFVGNVVMAAHILLASVASPEWQHPIFHRDDAKFSLAKRDLRLNIFSPTLQRQFANQAASSFML